MDRDALRDQINRLLDSEEFEGKEQLKRLLQFLFDRMDSQSRLKPARVIEELWPAHAGTKSSSDLATVISRLRKAIESYYAGQGGSDPILVHLPNRTAPAPNGNNGNRWITAEPRQGIEDEAPSAESIPTTWIDVSPGQPVPATPVRESSRRSLIALGVLMVALAVLSALAARSLRTNVVPLGARLEGSVFTVVNAEGKELWHKSFPQGFWKDYYDQGVATRTWFGDLEGNGRTEVLFLYHPSVDPLAHSTTLICYSDRGKERWRWTPGRALPEISASPSVFETLAFAVSKPRSGLRSQIVLSSYHLPYYPNQIAVLDADGKPLSEYWHSGHLDYMILADIDGDGKEEIIASGISNGYRQATLIVLDINGVFGASTEAARPELQLRGMIAAKERLRILFPRSDLNRSLTVYNRALEPRVERGRIQVAVRECDQQTDCGIYYEFDSQFNLLSAKASDGFRSAHSAFYLNSKDEHTFSMAEENALHNLTCLSGCN